MADTGAPTGDQSALMQHVGTIEVSTRGPGFYDVSNQLAAWLTAIPAIDGLVTVFIRHTSASLTIQENADPDVQFDLLSALDGFAPEHGGYRHASEGPDDMPAHIKSMLTATSLSIPVMDGTLALGTWQGLYVVEHRANPHRRELALHFAGTQYLAVFQSSI